MGKRMAMPIFYVRDNGIGIAPEHHDRIFGLFNKLNPSVEGTGVGTVHCEADHRGPWRPDWVESEEGRAPRFTSPCIEELQGLE